MTYFLLNNKRVFVENYNDDFLLFKNIDNDTSTTFAKLGEVIFKKAFHFIDEVNCTEVEICLKLNTRFNSNSIYDIIHLAENTLDHKTLANNNRSKTYKLPVCFDLSSDWHLIEEHTKLSSEDYIKKLLRLEFTLSMYGFLPGFLYLKGLPDILHCPRKTIPSHQVSANSIAIGAQYLGVYSLPSPGGWNIIGSSPFSTTNIPNLPPNLLNVGDKVILESISREKHFELQSSDQNLIGYNA